MARTDFIALYKYVGYPTYDYVLQSTPYASTLSDIVLKFEGPKPGSQIKFRILPNTSVYSSGTLYVGYSFADMFNHASDASGTYTSGVWKEFALNSDQLSVFANNSQVFVSLSVYENISFYTSGVYAPHITIPDSATIKYWNGNEWAVGTIKYYNGNAWVNGVAKIWDGTKWVNTQ